MTLLLRYGLEPFAVNSIWLRLLRAALSAVKRGLVGHAVAWVIRSIRWLYAPFQIGFPVQNVNDSSSAIMTVGAPPEEIETACSNVFLPPSDAAQAWRAAIEGKWTSAMR